MTSLNNSSATKCSKPKGQYCRLHNPAPAFKSMTPEQVFESAVKPKDLAATVPVPELDDTFEKISADLDASRQKLWDKATEKGIDIPDIGYHTREGEGYPKDEELAALEYDYHENQRAWEWHSETRSIQANTYLDNLVKAEFPSEKDQKLAHKAALGRFCTLEPFHEDSDSEYAASGVSRKEFFERVNDKTFQRKVNNIERAYLTLLSKKNVDERINTANALRANYAKGAPTSVDQGNMDDNSFYDNIFYLREN